MNIYFFLIFKKNFHHFYRFIFYDVNPGEGFNLRRDVYMRMAVMVKKLNENSVKYSYTLVSSGAYIDEKNWSTVC